MIEHAVERSIFCLIGKSSDIFACFGGLREGKGMIPNVSGFLLEAYPEPGDVFFRDFGKHNRVYNNIYNHTNEDSSDNFLLLSV